MRRDAAIHEYAVVLAAKLQGADLACGLRERQPALDDRRVMLDLVNEREIPIGDDFAREAVQAFSVDDDLQCMPYTVSPMVIYYNTDLINFERMRQLTKGKVDVERDHKLLAERLMRVVPKGLTKVFYPEASSIVVFVILAIVLGIGVLLLKDTIAKEITRQRLQQRRWLPRACPCTPSSGRAPTRS